MVETVLKWVNIMLKYASNSGMMTVLAILKAKSNLLEFYAATETYI